MFFCLASVVCVPCCLLLIRGSFSVCSILSMRSDGACCTYDSGIDLGSGVAGVALEELRVGSCSQAGLHVLGGDCLLLPTTSWL
jgi:hypothetical protein